MNASWLYRISSVLLVLFAAGHTLGFRKVNPAWGAGSVVESMRALHFDMNGFSRSYWDFFQGFGFFVTAFLLFSAVLAWQLGGISKETLAIMPVITWALAICFVSVTALSWKYFFLVPGLFSSLIALCLVLAAWLTNRPS